MTEKKPPNKAKKNNTADREARLAEALRQNLRRRKTQSRERVTELPAEGSMPSKT